MSHPQSAIACNLRAATLPAFLAMLATSTLGAQQDPPQSPTLQGVLVARLPNTQPPPFALSPDGKWVVEYGYYGNVDIRNLATSETRTLVNKPTPTTLGYVLSAAVTPSGEDIAYTWFNEDELVDIRIVRVDGSEPTVLYADPNVIYAAIKDWSPDGRQILAVIRRTDGSGAIVLIDVSDGSLRELKSTEVRPRSQLISRPVRGESPGGMAFSPDGRFIAYDASVAGPNPNYDIFVLAADGSRKGALVRHPATDVLLGWEPDGDGILLASDRNGSVDIWRQRVAGGTAHAAPELVAANVGPIMSLGVTADGSYYYTKRLGRCELFTAELDLEAGEFESLQHVGPAFNGGPRPTGVNWSPDGRRLVWAAPGEGVLSDTWTLIVRTMATGEEQRLPLQMDMLHGLQPKWSPDGRYVLVKGLRPGGNVLGISLYRVDVETGEPDAVVSSTSLTTMMDWPQWSADGNGILYLIPHRDHADIDRVVYYDLESAEETELLRIGPPPPVPYAFNASPDGAYFAFALWDPDQQRSSLRITPATGGEPLQLDGAVGPPLWWPDSRSLLYLAGPDAQLWHASVEGGKPRRLIPPALPAGLNPAGGSVHPDGRRIALIAQEPFHYEVWVIDNLGH